MRWAQRLSTGASLVAAGLTTEPAALADGRVRDSTVTLQVGGSARDGCPDEAAFVEAIARTLGETDASGHGARSSANTRSIQVAVVAESERTHATVSLHDAKGKSTATRSVEGASCKEVAEACVLIVVLSIDPLADIGASPVIGAAKPRASAPPSAPASRAPRGVRPKEPARAEAVAPAALLRASAGLAGGFAVGVLPGVSATFGPSGEIALLRATRPSVRVGLDVLSTSEIDAGPGRVAFRGAELYGAACPASLELATSTELGLCATWVGTHVTTRSSGFFTEETTSAWIFGLTGGTRLRFAPWRWLGLAASAEAGGALSPATWSVAGVGSVHDTSRVVLRVGLDVGIQAFR